MTIVTIWGLTVPRKLYLFNYLTTHEMEEVILQIYQALEPGGDSHLQVPHPSMIVCHDKGAIFRLDSVN